MSMRVTRKGGIHAGATVSKSLPKYAFPHVNLFLDSATSLALYLDRRSRSIDGPELYVQLSFDEHEGEKWVKHTVQHSRIDFRDENSWRGIPLFAKREYTEKHERIVYETLPSTAKTDYADAEGLKTGWVHVVDVNAFTRGLNAESYTRQLDRHLDKVFFSAIKTGDNLCASAIKNLKKKGHLMRSWMTLVLQQLGVTSDEVKQFYTHHELDGAFEGSYSDLRSEKIMNLVAGIHGASPSCNPLWFHDSPPALLDCIFTRYFEDYEAYCRSLKHGEVENHLAKSFILSLLQLRKVLLPALVFFKRDFPTVTYFQEHPVFTHPLWDEYSKDLLLRYAKSIPSPQVGN
jgi:hypothetical protein